MAGPPQQPAPAEHRPVLCQVVVQMLQPAPGRVVLDGTIGHGGHCRAIIDHLAPGGRYIGLDLDAQALAHVRRRLPRPPVRLDLVHGGFDRARQWLDELGIDRVDGLLADLGFNSAQVDDASRGLSFQVDGPLDMRLDRSSGPTAADLLARLSQQEIADLLWQFGQERYSRRIARKIVEARARLPIQTTGQLARICQAVYGRAARRASRAARHRSIHPATRTFQALRIAVNDELTRLDRLLEQVPQLLRPGARAVVISFHSLEDRRVKQAFALWARQGLARRLTTRPLGPDPAEVAANRRSRSARLRAIQWLGDATGR